MGEGKKRGPFLEWRNQALSAPTGPEQGVWARAERTHPSFDQDRDPRFESLKESRASDSLLFVLGEGKRQV